MVVQPSGPPASRPVDRVRTFWVYAVIVVVWSWVCVPKIIQTLLSPKYRSIVGVENAPYSRLAAAADYALYLGVIAICALVIVGYLNDVDTSAFGRLAVMVAPWAFIVVRDLYVPKALTQEGVAYLLIVLALWFLRPRIGHLRCLGYLMGLTAAVSIAIAVVLPAQAIFRTAAGEVIVDDKQILPWGILVGIFTQGNNLGQFLALGLPTVFLIRHRWHRAGLVALSLLAITWSASRGAMVAVGAGLLAYLLVRMCAPWLRRLVVPAAVAGGFAIACVVPFVTTTPDAFTNRGLVWITSLQAWGGNPWFGLGSNWYNEVGRTSARIAGSVFHAHNQLVQFLVTGGIVFALVVLPLLIVVTARATALAVRGEFFAASWLLTLAGSCLLEKSFAFVDNGNFLAATVLPLAVLVLGSDLSGSRPATAPAGESAERRPRPEGSGRPARRSELSPRAAGRSG